MERTHNHFLEPWAPHEIHLDYEYRRYHDRKQAGGIERLNPQVASLRTDKHYTNQVQKLERLGVYGVQLINEQKMVHSK